MASSTIETSTTIESDGDACDVIVPQALEDTDFKLKTTPSGMSTIAAIDSTECEFPEKFVAVMKFLATRYQFSLMSESEDVLEQLNELGLHATGMYFEDLYDTGDYDYEKVLHALGSDGTPEQRKTLLRAFLVLDVQTTCSVNAVFSGLAESFLEDEDGWLKEWLSYAPDGHCEDEYTALCKSYLEGKGPSLRELFVA
jgi:hypothetical protein